MNSLTRAREALGGRLRELRRQAGLSGKELAEWLGWPPSKVSKLELGQQTPTAQVIRAWAGATGAPAADAEELLASLTTLETHYQEYRRVLRAGTARRQKQLMELDAETKLFRGFEPAVVPGLLQTAAYAHAMLADTPDLYGSPDDIEHGVAARMRRQEILYTHGKQFHFVLTEAVLRYHLCPAEVLSGQLDRLLALSTLPNLRLGIIPFTSQCQAAPLHGFWIYDNRLVAVETLAASLNLAQPHEIQLYAKVFDRLAKAAHYTAAARSLINDALARLPSPSHNPA